MRFFGRRNNSRAMTMIYLTQLSMEFSPLINVKMPTIVGIFICMSGKNNMLGLTEPKKAEFLDFLTYEHLKFHA